MPSRITSDVEYDGCSTKAQPLLLTFYEGCLLMAAPPDLGHGVAPLGGQSFYLLCSGKRFRMAKNDPSP